MGYFCPRDQQPLSWRDYLFAGRYYCRQCSGTFALEAHLIRIPVFQAFLESLRESPNSDAIECPRCLTKMKSMTFERNQTVEIDFCESCRHYWFDPGELKAIEQSLATLSEDTPATERKSPIYIYSAYEEYQKSRAARFDKYLRVISILAICLNFWIYSRTSDFGQDYMGGSVRRGRALPPHASAAVAIFFLTLSLLFPRRLWMAVLAAAFFTFQALLIWVSRY